MMAARTVGHHDLQRAEAEEKFRLEFPGKFPVAVVWCGGDLWRVIHLSGCAYVDLAPDEPEYQAGLPGTLEQEGLF